MEYYAAIKKEQTTDAANGQISQMLQSETQKILSKSTYVKIWNRRNKPIVMEVRSLVAWSRCRGGDLIAKEHKGTFQGDRNVLYLDYGGSYISMYACQNSSICTLLYRLCGCVDLIAYKSYLNKVNFKRKGINVSLNQSKGSHGKGKSMQE